MEDGEISVIITILGMGTIIPLGISSNLGSCPSNVGIVSMTVEGLIILTQTMGLIGIVILVACAGVLYSKSKKLHPNMSRFSYGWLLFTGFLFAIVGIVGSGWLTHRSADLAPCVDGLFSLLSF